MSIRQWPVVGVLVCTIILGSLYQTTHVEADQKAKAGGGMRDEQQRTVPLTLGTKTVQATIADREPDRVRGLLGWKSITDDQGMLLDFSYPAIYAIHMEGMNFPIDALWLDQNFKIVLKYENIQPNSGRTYESLFPSRYCLELKAGFCTRYGIKVGQRVLVGKPKGR